MTDQGQPPAGWYPDPDEPANQKYWDGTSWTEDATRVATLQPPTPTADVTTPPRTNGLAIASFVLSLLTLCGVGSLLGVIFGHLSLGQIKREHQRGRGLAIAGLVLGYLGMAAGIVLLIVVLASSSTNDDSGVTADSPTTITAKDESKAATTTTPAKGEGKPVAVSGFTTREALGTETWASVGIVLTGLSGGSQDLTVSLLDAAGTPIATNTEYVGSDRDGGEVLVSSSFADNVPTAASVRVDITNASSFIDATPFPVTVASQGFDGNFWTVTGTATNDTSKNITSGKITCVAFKAGRPVAGGETFTDTMVPGAQVAFKVTDTFDPQADEVRCQGEAS